MNATEVGKLLGLMSLADYRKVPEDPAERAALIAFWLDLLRDYPYDDCAAAVRAHYAESAERMMPVHVINRVREIRAERLRLNPPGAPPAELCDDGAAYSAYVNDQHRRIADGEPGRKAVTS